MDRDFLEDYDRRELEEHEKYVKWIIEDKGGTNPLLTRLVKPQEPIVRSGYCGRKESIWAQIPLSGSLIWRVPSFEKEDFEETYNIRATEIPDLVDFIKDTGRLQITLGMRPLDYVGLDYLAPILEELQPFYEKGFPPRAFISLEDEMKHGDEYLTLANVVYSDFLRNVWTRIKKGDRESASKMVMYIMRREVSSYTYLKLLGYNDVVEELQNLMVDDPVSANLLFLVCQAYITSPFTDPLCKSLNASWSYLKELDELKERFAPLKHISLSDIHIPCEIGKFLMTKLTHYPESFEACKELIAHYESTDLIKVASELNRGISEAVPDLITKSKEELSQIMTELWEDKSITRKINGLKFGIPVSIAAIGSVAFGPIGGLTGFLAGLGFSVGTKILDAKRENLSERIAKFISPSYQANIYDFKKKYRSS